MIRAIVHSAPRIGVNVREIAVKIQGDLYTGEYDVIPSQLEQQLETEGKIMARNVLVSAVPMSIAKRSQVDRLF